MLPVLGALILQAAYGAVDLLVVGRFGSTAGLSAVSTGSQLLNLVTFVVTQLAMGVTVLIARYIGGTDWCCAGRRGRGVCHFIRSNFCFAGRLCPADFCADAGPGGGADPDHQLCAYLRCRYFLYCGV